MKTKLTALLAMVRVPERARRFFERRTPKAGILFIPKSKSYDYQSAEKKAEKLVLNKNRESLCEKQDIKLQEIKEYIQKQKRNAFFRVGGEFKIPL